MNEDDVTELGAQEHEGATRHRELALDAVVGEDTAAVAVVHALLAIEARVEELVVYLAQLR